VYKFNKKFVCLVLDPDQYPEQDPNDLKRLIRTKIVRIRFTPTLFEILWLNNLRGLGALFMDSLLRSIFIVGDPGYSHLRSLWTIAVYLITPIA
jgi:hypothetical protein